MRSPPVERGTLEGAHADATPRSVDGSTSRHDLDEAARRVLDCWRGSSDETGTEAEFREELGVLVRDLAEPHPVAAGIVESGTGVLRRRALELLRAELIQLWSESESPPPSRTMLALLERVEQVRRRLEPNWEQYFASRLSGPEGIELVVEVAHDLRSPLTSILFLAETLRRGQSGVINDVQRRQLGIIYSAALGLISIASDMIELARGGTQLMEQEASPFSVVGVLDSVRDIVQPMAEEKGLALRILPPEVDQRLGYPVALSRVLLNLTSNALKFTEEGMIEITVREHAPDEVEFSVRDTGRGLDSDALRNLFQPFRRTRGRKGHAFSGSGLGLMISRRLVLAMGGELRFETRPDWGTRFFFRLHLPVAPRT
jgi:signal transduction histidine kinase